MTTTPAKKLELLDRPLIGMAGLAVGLYLCELFRFFPDGYRPWLFWVGFTIDLAFLLDLIAKIVILRKPYLESPWFVVDLVSTLPIVSSLVELFGVVVYQFQFLTTVRVARLARMGQTVRMIGLSRVARALRIARGLAFLKSVPPDLQKTPAFNRALWTGAPILVASFVAASFYLQTTELTRTEARIRERVSQASTIDEVRKMREYLTGRAAVNPHIPKVMVERTFGGRPHTFVMSLDRGLADADKLQGVLLLLVLVTVSAVVFIVSSLAADQRKNREIAILAQCFSPPIVERFANAPETLERYYSRWMSVFFIDVCGFTATAEDQGADLEGLAMRLRKVMDIARRSIVVTHEGVVDKFIGDAVMGWIGGHFSKHWEILVPSRAALFIDQLESAGIDRHTLLRDVGTAEARLPGEAAADPRRLEIARLSGTIDELTRRQRELVERSPEVERDHARATDLYRRTVARSAVRCLLRISEEVRLQEAPDAFRNVKIGLASGDVCVGNFGSSDQIGFTVLGPTVNHAARLEPASAQVGCRILCDRVTRELVGDADGVAFRRVGLIAVKGVADGMQVFEPFDRSREDLAFLSRFDEALALVESGDLEGAIGPFEAADGARPGGDPASRVWIARIREALAAGVRVIGPYHAAK